MKQLLIALIATAFGLFIEHTFLRGERSTVSRVFKGWQSDRGSTDRWQRRDDYRDRRSDGDSRRTIGGRDSSSR